ncbi:related to phenylcoumaran benzylic ether reductase [Ramularia collo-cygni]|uniref:Related to phenylcoumaran benzylic ether reductase n=1 Tax=Ramularia collo-cygni TaxID=112498 RepID=A0A2D3VD40_9PEZI|nr:related to phenylcoumaran benzylic ether reductase [Ramularia collo-cygni]CZT23655.1 related to phenylcoumaran benzylic ether reductase [Ramularia collo-cygni]
MASKNILIFGSTGLIGTRITNAIVANKAHWDSVSIFTSKETVASKSERIEELKRQGVRVITGDFTSESDVNEAYKGIDTVVSCVGRPVIDKQLLLIQLADKHPDVKRFLPSEYGTDIEYWESSANEKPHQLKLKVRALFKEVTNLDYTYVVTGPYGDADGGLYLGARKPEEEAVGCFDVKRKRAVVIGDGNGKISLSTMRDVGKFVVGALLHPEESRNKALHVNSFTTTENELVTEFEKQTGGQKWDVGYTSLAKLRELEEEAYKNGNPKAGGITLRRIWASGGTLYDQRDNHLIGLEEGIDDLQSAVQLSISVQEGSSK